MTTTPSANEDRFLCVCWDMINLIQDNISKGIGIKKNSMLTTNELSNESVYQQSFVEKKGVFSNSGRKIDTNCLIAYKAGSGSSEHSSAGRGTDH